MFVKSGPTKDDGHTMSIWAAPALKMSNMFVNKEAADVFPVKGYVLLYQGTSPEGNFEMETTAINQNASITINTKEYKSMF